MNHLLVIFAAIALVLSIVSLPLWVKWSSPLSPPTNLAADLIVRNGLIFTADDALPFADSIAVRGGRILRVGNYSSLQDLVVYGTEEIDLEGKVVVPGFIDSHVHLVWGGLQMERMKLQGVNQKDEFVRRVEEAAVNMDSGSWIVGGGWNNDLWGGELPNASWIDSVTPNHPVWLTRMDGHMGLANSAALRISGITNLTKDPDGGSVLRNACGDPTGLLVDAAMRVVGAWIPQQSVDGRRQALDRASDLALSRGVTTVVDMGRYVPGEPIEHSWDDLSEVYQWADASGKMKIRVCLFFPIQTWSRLHDSIRSLGRVLSDRIYFGGVKAFADGSLGSNSALFYEPYNDEPSNYGLLVMDQESLFDMTLDSDKHGLQVSIHAIGDRANGLVMDMYESVASRNGKRDRRFRIEHVQHLAPGKAEGFGKQGVAASVQPDHLLDDADPAIKKLGIDRANKGSYLFKSLLSSNALLALGSDWPVVDINPLGAIRTAMKRIPHGWEDAWVASERLSLPDALMAHTISAARACFLENELGSLSPGKLADFVILSTKSWDAFAADSSASVEATFVSGKLAYQRYPS